MGTITNEGGEQATDDEDKRRMMAEVSFPAPNPYDGPRSPPGPPGKAYRLVDHALVHSALYQQSNKKAPGKDAIGVAVIKALFRWDSWRVVALVRQCIRLGFHPADWKVAKGVCSYPKTWQERLPASQELQSHLSSQLLGKAHRESNSNPHHQ
jgi:hypothetical protein